MKKNKKRSPAPFLPDEAAGDTGREAPVVLRAGDPLIRRPGDGGWYGLPHRAADLAWLCRALTLALAVGCLVGLCGCRSKGFSNSNNAQSEGGSASSAQSGSGSQSAAASGSDSSGVPGVNEPATNDTIPDESGVPGTSSSSDTQVLASQSEVSQQTQTTGQIMDEAAAGSAWALTLVNTDHLLTEAYQPELAVISGSEKQFDARAVDQLNALLAAAKADGQPCHVVSGYRSVKYQQGLFNRKVQSYLDQGMAQQEAETQAAQWVARPGSSEHSLGLAVDLVSGDWYLEHDDLTEEFEQTTQFEWLSQHAAEYGFVLRYPKDKESVTGVHYEPWHYRYVGDAAVEIAASGLTLEEYLQQHPQS